jgi:hypothetical protein
MKRPCSSKPMTPTAAFSAQKNAGASNTRRPAHKQPHIKHPHLDQAIQRVPLQAHQVYHCSSGHQATGHSEVTNKTRCATDSDRRWQQLSIAPIFRRIRQEPTKNEAEVRGALRSPTHPQPNLRTELLRTPAQNQHAETKHLSKLALPAQQNRRPKRQFCPRTCTHAEQAITATAPTIKTRYHRQF